MEQNLEELENEAWEIYAEALKNIKIPENVFISKRDDGTFSCAVMLSYEGIGTAYVNFIPSTDSVKRLLKITESVEGMSVDYGKDVNYFYAVAFAQSFLENFFAEIEQTFSGLLEIPTILPLLLISSSTSDEHKDKKFRVEESKKCLEELLENRKQITKKRIADTVQNVEEIRQPVIHLIALHYKNLLIKWEKAKDFYKKNKNFDNWEKMIAVGFEDLPTELLKRLGDPDTYTAMPSSIALEHAARICGVKPNSVGLRTLQNYLQQSREWIQENGVEKAEEEAKNYYQRTFGQVVMIYRVANSLDNKMPSLENYSLLHQIIAHQAGESIKEVIAKNKAKKNDERNDNELIH